MNLNLVLKSSNVCSIANDNKCNCFVGFYVKQDLLDIPKSHLEDNLKLS